MSLSDLMAWDAENTHLNTDDFAASVTRYPLGDTAAGAPVTANWQEDQPKELIQAGKETERWGTLYVLKSQAADVRDRWLVDSEVWDAVTVGPIEGSLKQVRVKRVSEERRNTTRAR